MRAQRVQHALARVAGPVSRFYKLLSCTLCVGHLLALTLRALGVYGCAAERGTAYTAARSLQERTLLFFLMKASRDGHGRAQPLQSGAHAAGSADVEKYVVMSIDVTAPGAMIRKTHGGHNVLAYPWRLVTTTERKYDREAGDGDAMEVDGGAALPRFARSVVAHAVVLT